MIKKSASRIQDEIIRRMDGHERLRIAFELNNFARRIIKANIKVSDPKATEAELMRMVSNRFKK